MFATDENECRSETSRLQFHYRLPWPAVFGLSIAAIYFILPAIGCIVSSPPHGISGLLVVVYATCFLLAGAAFFVLMTRELRNRRRPLRKFVLTDAAIEVPGRWGSFARTPVPYGGISRIELIRHLNYPKDRLLRVTHRNGRFAVFDACLPRRTDFDELVNSLSAWVEPFGVPIESRDTWFGMRWPRPQFSILSILLLTTFVAILLGVFLWSGLDWRALIFVGAGLACFYFFPFALIFAGSRTTLVFGLGFASGMVVEWVALYCWFKIDWIQPLPGTVTPAGWYPLALPSGRLLAALGWVDPLAGFIYGMFTGVLASGILAGILALIGWVLWQCWRRPIAKPRRIA